jgi:hypothetical protein
MMIRAKCCASLVNGGDMVICDKCCTSMVNGGDMVICAKLCVDGEWWRCGDL